MIIVAHRGASKIAPENTLQAFQKAIDIGADMLEFDVRKTQDGALVVFHDPDCQGLQINTITLKKLKELSYGFIPTLEEALQVTAGKIKLDVELKEKGCAKEAVPLLLKYFSVNNFFISSFKKPILAEVFKENPSVRLGWILGNDGFQSRLKILFDILKVVINPSTTDRYQYLIVNKHIYNHQTFSFLPYQKKQVFIWTVDNEKMINMICGDSRVNGVITNVPDLALKIRNE